ncbi:CRISPR-associated ring nuclease Csm6 [Vibrio mediterranei]|uniref:CRISPR-associated ring nuclease Csm6 n=1 Tax=Vibrio mediterranei TaxID=689 RepID=UPI001EFE1F43|nr:CRISPR-associated ring nuclease Csm6 [Vibrio mediterranei]MCG9665939.1 CRISPR-associated ring nuclease Csm6 [Vibrio mediterranei]
MKNILLSTTGTSPQVLTETLFAIAKSGRPFPDEVYVITTQSSKDVLLNGLIRDGHLEALKSEYQLPEFTFDESHVWLIENDKGEYIDDAKSIDDQTFMADFITKKVFELTQNDNTAIHASLAGGRKTMAFYFGYAMSMFGRSQDTLSHVFVDDAYEFVRDFWYPTKNQKWVTGKNGQGEVDVSQATVTLAEIPFVRMRNAVDPTVLSTMANLSFSQTVGMLNSSREGELSVTIDGSSKLISTLGIGVSLTAKELAFYLWLLDKGTEGLLVDRYFEDLQKHSIDFLNTYRQFASDPRVFSTFGTTPEDFSESDYSSLSGMSKDFLQPICSTINRKLKKALPTQTAGMLEVTSISEGINQRYSVALCHPDIEVTVINKHCESES